MYFLFINFSVFLKDFLKEIRRLSGSMLVPLTLRESASLSLNFLHNYLQLLHSEHADHGKKRKWETQHFVKRS